MIIFGDFFILTSAMADQRITVGHKAQLLEYLFGTFSGRSRTSIKSLLTHGQIEVNGRPVSAFDFPLKTNDVITIREHGRKRSRKEEENPLEKALGRQVRIVHEDDDLIVVEKAAGLLTMSTGKAGEVTAYSVLTEYVRSRSGSGMSQSGNSRTDTRPRIFIVHRIDRETSGLLVFAKNRKTQEALQDNWNDCVRERKYVAVVEGHLSPAEGRITSWLKEHPKSLKMISDPYDNGGKKAVTRYRTIGQNRGYSLVEFELDTGRKNQIRIHASDMGCPIAGDYKYGASTDPIGRLALHALTLSFRHPGTGKVMRFETPFPELFRL